MNVWPWPLPAALTLFAFVLLQLLSPLIEAAEDNDVRPHVAWVPIVQRNVSDTVSSILQELNERQKLQRIGTILNNTYVRLEQEAEEGQKMIESLETRYPAAVAASSSSSVFTSTSLFILPSSFVLLLMLRGATSSTSSLDLVI